MIPPRVIRFARPLQTLAEWLQPLIEDCSGSRWPPSVRLSVESRRSGTRSSDFYDRAQVGKRLSVEEEAVLAMISEGTVIALLTTDGAQVFPGFQFDGSAEARAVLGGAFQVLKATGVDDWTAAGWIVARHEELDDMCVVDWLWDGRGADRVRWLAGDTARRFNS